VGVENLTMLDGRTPLPTPEPEPVTTFGFCTYFQRNYN